MPLPICEAAQVACPGSPSSLSSQCHIISPLPKHARYSPIDPLRTTSAAYYRSSSSRTSSASITMPQSPDAGTPPPPTQSTQRRRVERQRTDVTYPRKRAVRACKTCRVKKVKCNNARPICGMCAEFNATCTYDDSTEDCSR